MNRRVIALAASLVLAVGLAACGSGGGTSSGDTSTGTVQTAAEASWVKGVQERVADFMADGAPSDLGARHHGLIEFAYDLKVTDTRVAFQEVEEVLPPPGCKGARKEVLDVIKRLGKQTEELVNKHDLSRDEYAALYVRQAKKIDKTGRELVDLTSSITCEGISGSTDSEPTAESIAEAGWIREVTFLVRSFEYQGHSVEKGEAREGIEFIYGFEATVAGTLQSEIEEEDMPASCEESRGSILDAVKQIEEQREMLAKRSDLDQKEYFALLRPQTEKIDRSKQELRELTSPITC